MDILQRTGDAAQFVRFRDGSAGLLLQSPATRYQIVHELKPYEHWLASPLAYCAISKLEREEFVFASIQKSNHWRLFNDTERLHAAEYIQYLRKLFRSQPRGSRK
ncbi:MAG: zincin-like metallopeptidase toxin domain-containing protein [Planctomyces sp.]